MKVGSHSFPPTLIVAASTSLDSQIRLWDLNAQQLLKAIDSGPVEAWTCAFSPDGRLLATGTHAGKINIWNIETSERVNVLETKGKFVMSITYVSSEKCFGYMWSSARQYRIFEERLATVGPGGSPIL